MRHKYKNNFDCLLKNLFVNLVGIRKFICVCMCSVEFNTSRIEHVSSSKL
jgi:hypothetical protein